MADLDEAGGQDVKQEAADELDRVEGHDCTTVVMSGVPPAKSHLSLVEAEESSVGDGDAVGVAGQVLQHVFRTAEGRLGVDHPLLVAHDREQGVKCTWLRERSQRAGEAEFVVSIALPEEGEQLAAEHAAEHTYRQKEVMP